MRELRSQPHCSQLQTTNPNTLNSAFNDYVYNDIPVIAIEFHGPGHDASILPFSPITIFGYPRQYTEKLKK